PAHHPPHHRRPFEPQPRRLPRSATHPRPTAQRSVGAARTATRSNASGPVKYPAPPPTPEATNNAPGPAFASHRFEPRPPSNTRQHTPTHHRPLRRCPLEAPAQPRPDQRHTPGPPPTTSPLPTRTATRNDASESPKYPAPPRTPASVPLEPQLRRRLKPPPTPPLTTDTTTRLGPRHHGATARSRPHQPRPATTTTPTPAARSDARTTTDTKGHEQRAQPPHSPCTASNHDHRTTPGKHTPPHHPPPRRRPFEPQPRRRPESVMHPRPATQRSVGARSNCNPKRRFGISELPRPAAHPFVAARSKLQCSAARISDTPSPHHPPLRRCLLEPRTRCSSGPFTAPA
ncbi:hypothetical protein SAMN05216270_1201, partial [Glycomyces harbinensis]